MKIISSVIIAMSAFTFVNGTSAAEKAGRNAREGKEPRPHPVVLSYYISGVSRQTDADKIVAALAKVPGVTSAAGLTPESGYVQVAFDTHAITSHYVAQTIMDQGPFTVTQKFEVSGYPGHADKLDAIFAKLLTTRKVKIEPLDPKSGRFQLTFLPIELNPDNPREAGFNPGHLGHPIHDAPPRGLGLTVKYLEAPSTRSASPKGERGSAHRQ